MVMVLPSGTVLDTADHDADRQLCEAEPELQADSLAGSGPSLRPYGASTALTSRTVLPGRTRTRGSGPCCGSWSATMPG
jgi:hypothetical protein